MKVAVMGGAVSCASSACRSKHVQPLAASNHDIRHPGRAVSSSRLSPRNETDPAAVSLGRPGGMEGTVLVAALGPH